MIFPRLGDSALCVGYVDVIDPRVQEVGRCKFGESLRHIWCTWLHGSWMLVLGGVGSGSQTSDAAGHATVGQGLVKRSRKRGRC